LDLLLPSFLGNAPDGDFVEIKNVGNVSVTMTGSVIQELQYTFPPLTLRMAEDKAETDSFS
jgi:hypothetical protein